MNRRHFISLLVGAPVVAARRDAVVTGVDPAVPGGDQTVSLVSTHDGGRGGDLQRRFVGGPDSFRFDYVPECLPWLPISKS